MPDISSSKKNRNVIICFWTVLFFLAAGIRVAIDTWGEYICFGLLFFSTIYGLTCWEGPGRAKNSHIDDENPTATDVSAAASLNNDNDVVLVEESETSKGSDPTTGENESIRGNNTISKTTSTKRLPFLDNIKSFLTALVVTHHVACAFGACGDGWYLVVGFDGSPTFTTFIKTLVLLDQSFFMSLFFFISAFFVPSSYERAGCWEKFQKTKSKRILIPAILNMFVLSPLVDFISGTKGYNPNPGVAWYLFWLLLFNMVYVSFLNEEEAPSESLESITGEQSASSNVLYSSVCETKVDDASFEGLILQHNDETNYDLDCEVTEIANAEPFFFPSTRLRVCCGVGICGLLLIPFVFLFQGTFASMPISIGSLTCDLLMFYMGLQAKKNLWFENSLTEHLDITPITLAGIVAFEGSAIAVMGIYFDAMNILGLPLIIVAGMFCLDMSLLVLYGFQRWMNFETKLSRFFARGAYGVYLLHPLIVVGMTLLWTAMCDKYKWEGSSLYTRGWMFVTFASHLICWPLAYFFAQLPFVKTII